AAGAAAAAEALCEQAVRVDTCGGDVAAAVDCDVVCTAAACAGAAEGERTARTRDRQRAGDGESAITAATADALRQDAVGTIAGRLQIGAGADDVDDIAGAAAAAFATDCERCCRALAYCE